jgi:hypothetical protein
MYFCLMLGPGLQKFSMQGGMGAALLKTPDLARRIIHTLSSNLSIPGGMNDTVRDLFLECPSLFPYLVFPLHLSTTVTAKIRIIDTVEQTIAFMQMLEAAGAAAITGEIDIVHRIPACL